MNRTIENEKKYFICWEAARWAPSSMNEQPWRFLIALKDEASAFGNLLRKKSARTRTNLTEIVFAQRFDLPFFINYNKEALKN